MDLPPQDGTNTILLSTDPNPLRIWDTNKIVGPFGTLGYNEWHLRWFRHRLLRQSEILNSIDHAPYGRVYKRLRFMETHPYYLKELELDNKYTYLYNSLHNANSKAFLTFDPIVHPLVNSDPINDISSFNIRSTLLSLVAEHIELCDFGKHIELTQTQALLDLFEDDHPYFLQRDVIFDKLVTYQDDHATRCRYPSDPFLQHHYGLERHRQVHLIRLLNPLQKEEPGFNIYIPVCSTTIRSKNLQLSTR